MRRGGVGSSVFLSRPRILGPGSGGSRRLFQRSRRSCARVTRDLGAARRGRRAGRGGGRRRTWGAGV